MGEELSFLSPVHRCQETGTEMIHSKNIIFTRQNNILLLQYSGSWVKMQWQSLALTKREVVPGEWGRSFRARLLKVSAVSIEKFYLALQDLALLFPVVWYQRAQQTRCRKQFLSEQNLFTVVCAAGVQFILSETSEYCMDVFYGAVAKTELT